MIVWQAREVDGLLDDMTLAASAVVANSAMNRERQLAGPNSYARELGFDPLDRLLRRLPDQESVAWLDLCCGRGRALLQAGAQVEARGLQDRVELIGVDLVDYFDPGTTAVTLVCTPATAWQPHRRFDLVTVVHGLHYIGDKLGVLEKAANWLTDDGLLIADFDADSIRRDDGEPFGRSLTTQLKKAGFAYDGRKRRISRTGPAHQRLPFRYLGADDRAGPDYTGQPAVHSYYAATRARAAREGRAASPRAPSCSRSRRTATRLATVVTVSTTAMTTRDRLVEISQTLLGDVFVRPVQGELDPDEGENYC